MKLKMMMAAGLALGLSAVGCGNDAEDALAPETSNEAGTIEGLDEGVSAPPLSRDGKADGQSAVDRVVYSTAMTVGPLLYQDFEGEDEKERDDATLDVIFDDKISPASASDQPWQYLRKMSAMGYYGPLGPYGPLGLLGPTGGNPWNADLYITGSFGWSDWSEELTAEGGPLSAEGPLGENGPLNPELWKPSGEDTPDGAFIDHLRPGGIFAPLGPVGVSGALGPLGPLGPIGAYGYEADDSGQYWPEEDAEQKCNAAPEGCQTPPGRRSTVSWNEGEDRVYELVELYDEAHASAMTDNDTSFVVSGEIEEPGDGPDTFAFASARDQWVTILLVPQYAKYPFAQAMAILGQSAALGYQVPSAVTVPNLFTGIFVAQDYNHYTSFDDFDIEVELVQGGKSIGTIASQSGDAVDWIHVRVPAGTEFKAQVSLYNEWGAAFQDSLWGLTFRPSTPAYRLVVVGSTGTAQGQTAFAGPYLQSIE